MGFKIENSKVVSSKLEHENSIIDVLNIDILPFKLNNKRKEVFYIELYSMLSAGMDIKDSLDIIIDQGEKSKEKNLFENLKENLIGGMSLSQCLRRSGYFTPYEYYCVQIGEESGRLIDVLEQLSDFFTKKIKLRQQIVKSLSYPLVILMSSLLAVGFMLTFIVPMFSSIFKRFGSDLPVITKAFINMSNGLKDNSAWILGSLTILTVSLFFVWNKLKFKRVRQRFVDKVPYVNRLIRGVYLSRFCASMALLIGAKVPLVNSVSLVKKMIDYYPISNSLDKLELELINGVPLYKGMSTYSIYDKKMLALIKVGEEVNKLDVFFDKLNQRYSNEVDSTAVVLNTFLEPLIIGILGVIIGVMLVAMYLPMFRLSSSIG